MLLIQALLKLAKLILVTKREGDKQMVGNETWEDRQLRLKKEYEEYISGKRYFQYAFKLICAYCGEEFYCKNRMQKYCCYRCVNDNYIQKRRERKALEKQKICSMCNKKYTAKKKDSLYCSDACKQKAYRIRKRDTSSPPIGV